MSVFYRLTDKISNNLPDRFPSNLPWFRDRFWYWKGQSGKKYIHSIYCLAQCPPLPGAIYVTVQKMPDGRRKPLEVGRFANNWDYVEALIEDQRCGLVNIDEIHVHLLASSDKNADEVLSDLEGTIGHRAVFAGFYEEQTQPIAHGFHNNELKMQEPTWQADLFELQPHDNKTSYNKALTNA